VWLRRRDKVVRAEKHVFKNWNDLRPINVNVNSLGKITQQEKLTLAYRYFYNWV